MKTSFELIAEFRDDQGKGASRRLRRSGKVPAILYGGHQDARSLALDHARLVLMLDNERFYSTILSLKVGEEKQAAVLKDLQRHPYKNQIVHIDFQRVLEDEKIRMRIPLHFLNEATSVGVKTQGGVVSHLRNDVEISCLPKDLPGFIEVDLSELTTGHAMHVSALKLPEGVKVVTRGKADPVVAAAVVPRAQVEVEGEAAPAAEAAAAAPAEAAAEKKEPAKEEKKKAGGKDDKKK